MPRRSYKHPKDAAPASSASLPPRAAAPSPELRQPNSMNTGIVDLDPEPTDSMEGASYAPFTHPGLLQLLRGGGTSPVLAGMQRGPHCTESGLRGFGSQTNPLNSLLTNLARY